MTDSPNDPMTVMAEGAASMRETYVTFREAGFTRSEALELLGMIMKAAFETEGHKDA